jgi:L-alanine-DL-glutamate epimerase-like enolase superfamily enzyme
MKLAWSDLRLELRDTFRIARESSDFRDNVLVKIKDADGCEGLGEAAPSRYYGQSAASVADALERIDISGATDPYTIDDVLDSARAGVGDQSSALAAIDMGLYDLIGKRLSAPLYRLFGVDPEKAPATSYTIGIASLDEIRRKTEEASEYTVLKVKLGADNDREIISAIRDVTSAPIRIDANAAWTVQTAMENIRWLADEGVELVEQPLPKDDLEGHRRLTESSPLPIIADESAVTAKDVVRLNGCVHGVNIKLGKCGGLHEALKMIHIARAQDMKIMLGCFIESSVGITAAAHLSPLIDYADLDGHLLIRNDPYIGVKVRDGRLVLPDGPGIGLMPA